MGWRTNNANFHFQGGMTGQSEDTGYEVLEREANSYQAGSYPKLEDQLDQGSDDE
jgi:hypothetical protein